MPSLPAFLDGLTADECQTALARMEELVVQQGDLLIHRGQSGDALA